jgi:hypothetical protein
VAKTPEAIGGLFTPRQYVRHRRLTGIQTLPEYAPWKSRWQPTRTHTRTAVNNIAGRYVSTAPLEHIALYGGAMSRAQCSRCENEARPSGRYCSPCHNAYMRLWRKSHPLNDEQKKKDNARSYANVYVRRGKLIPEPCVCGSSEVEMHHPDYDKPLIVIWMCRPCHMSLHVEHP